MAKSVNIAFSEFMKDVVNLNPLVTQKARESRDNLLSNISEFDNKDEFFNLCDLFNVHFGSFARKTKCRELDDIDLMIGISSNGATYLAHSWDNVTIQASTVNMAHINCTDDQGHLNSTKVLNMFKKKLEHVREYLRSDIKRSGEAVVLNLISKDWSFDIVPCFQTVEEADGRSYYLIPNGSGYWKKTDPTIDRNKILQINKEKKGRVLELVRLTKCWSKTKKISTIPSYLLESLILNYCSNQDELKEYIDMRFTDTLEYIANNIAKLVLDPKNIQGNINTLSGKDKDSLRQAACDDFSKARIAFKFETDDKDHKKAINKWIEIFGGEFPAYG